LPALLITVRAALRNALIAVMLLSIAVPAWAWSQGRRGAFPHRHRVVFVGTFYGGPYWYGPPPYYYAPLYLATEVPPSVYVEKFEGTPSADAGEIYCPALDAHYPEVQECPNGWQRIIRAEETTAGGG
jgi:cbb3-type cytochrome oxidase subunit 3